MLANADGSPVRLGFIGAGMMAGAMMRGLVKTNVCPANAVIASDAYQPCLDALSSELGIKTTSNNGQVAEASDVVVIAVKPHHVRGVCKDIAAVSPMPLVVSIAAGITIATLEENLSAQSRVARVMPNTPCLVGELAAAYAPNAACSDADAALVGALFGAIGTAFKVQEKDLDAVTGLSGSGCSYSMIRCAHIGPARACGVEPFES